jgi:hypothetical protein
MNAVCPSKLVWPNIAPAKGPPGFDPTFTMVPRSEHPFLA